MSNLSLNCCVCINNNQKLINIFTTDIHQVQWSNKLTKCVPEVDWGNDCHICTKCIEHLEIAYTFYNLCVQSYEVRKQSILPIKTERDEFPEWGLLNEDESFKMGEEEMDVKEFIYVKSEKLDSNENEQDSCISINNNDEELLCTSPDIMGAQANAQPRDLLSLKSRHHYGLAYDQFQCWAKKNKANPKCITENLLLAYFSELSEAQKSSSLWSKYSMLRSTVLANDQVDIKKFNKLLLFLKHQARGYKAKQFKNFTKDNIIKFLRDAPDAIHLLKKVVLIIGIAAACRIEELTYLETDKIRDTGSALIITLKDTVTKQERNVTIINNQDPNFPNMLDIYRKYISLRPAHTNHKRLFLQYVNGKCTTQVIGRHTMGKIPSQIAEYLNLAEPEAYTGHTLRKTSAIMNQ